MIRSLAVALILSSIAASALAQEPVEPRFFIERIEIRGAKRVSPDVVIYESRLRAGEEYREADLSDAATRLNRLPFLLSAEFSFDRGSERGQYILVITIAETKPFFFLIDARPIISSKAGIVDVDYTDRLGSAETQAALGFRWFIGRRGAAHVGISSRNDNRDFTRDHSFLAVGYTQYDIFGTRAFATVNVKRPLDPISTGVLSPQIVAGIPLSANQTVTVTYDRTRFGGDETNVRNVATVEERDDEQLVSARWSLNTTNDPFLPTSGTLVSVTPFIAWRDIADYSLTGRPFPDPEVQVDAYAVHMNSYGIDVAAARSVELSERDSVAVGVEGGWANVDVRSNNVSDWTGYASSYWLLHTGYSHSLWNREEQKRGDSRLEASLRYINRNGGERRSFFMFQQDVVQASASWVRRSSWGTFRLGAGYAW